jgi:hypothetical protein
MADGDLPGEDALDGTEKTHENADGTVVRLRMERTESDRHPSGWRYSLHYGLRAGTDAPILRYDNAHEPSQGHERHTLDGVEEIDFPGMVALYDRFVREYNELRGIGPQ